MDKLEPLSIAIWYCDDGSLIGTQLLLYTYGFGNEGNSLIQKWFKERYNINFKLGIDKRVKNQFNSYLRANKVDSLNFIDLIKDYVPECMSYKIDLKRINKMHREYLFRRKEKNFYEGFNTIFQ